MPIPNNLGVFVADGGLYLNKAEREWLADLLERIDTAYSEIAISTTMPPPPDYVERYSARALAEVVAPFAVVSDIRQTQEDDYNGVQKKRAEITIIKGGVPPRPAF